MSQIEVDSIDALNSIVGGQELEIISLKRQRQVALWAAKTAMMADLTQSAPIISQTQLRRMKTHKAIPGGTRVWIGSCAEMYPLVTSHTVRIELEEIGASADSRPVGLYCPMKVGHLCLYVYFPSANVVIRHPAFYHLSLARIWPRRGSDLAFPPPVQAKDGPGFERFADQLWRDWALFTPEQAKTFGIKEL